MKQFFVYDPESGFEVFDSEEEALTKAKECIASYLGDGENGYVTQVVVGIMTHRATETDRTERPDDLDEEECDGEGTYWGDWTHICNYKMKPVKMERNND